MSDLPLAIPGTGLKLRKVATESFVRPDGHITYLLTVHNIGDQDLTDVVVTDLVPTGLNFAYAQFDASAVVETSQAPPTYAIAALASHEVEVIALTFATPQNPNLMDEPGGQPGLRRGPGPVRRDRRPPTPPRRWCPAPRPARPSTSRSPPWTTPWWPAKRRTISSR